MGRRSVYVVCGWLLWQLLIVDREQKFIPLGGPMGQAACLAAVRPHALYEQRVGPLVWYADITVPTTRPAWHGCFPEDYDPRIK